MLILTRKVGQYIYVGEDITVHLLSMEGSNVRLGFIAPKDVVILRSEVKARQDFEIDKSSTINNINLIKQPLR